LANRYWRAAATTNWATAGNWELTPGGGESVTVPGSSDDVFFVAGSGATSTVGASITVKSINCTGYTGTLTVSSTFVLTVAGSILFSSDMSLSGTGTLTLSATGTWTSNGKTIPWSLTIGNSTMTATLADDWTVSGLVTIGSGSSQTLNSNNLYCESGFTFNGRVAGTTNIRVTAGTFTGNSVASRYISNPVYLSSGVAFASTIYIAATTLTFGGSHTGTITISIAATGTMTFAGTLPTLSTLATLAAVTLALPSTLTITNGLTLAGNLTLTGYGLSCGSCTTSAAVTWTMVADCSISGQLSLGGNLTLSGAYIFSVGGILQTTTTATITRNTATLTADSISIKASQTSTILGASGLSISSLYMESGAGLIFPASQTLTVSTIIDIAGTLLNRCSIASGTGSSAFSLTYNGTSANMNIDEMNATDVTFSAPNVNNGVQVHGGGTFTRCTGIVNVSGNMGDNVPPAVTNVRSGTAYWLNGASVNGSCSVPIAANVLAGVAVDATTGTFDEAARNTDPGIANVRSGTNYKIQNSSLTGTMSGGAGSTGYPRSRVANA